MTLPRMRQALLWWLALYALWWLCVGSWSGWSAVWGAVLAAVATVAAVLTHRTVPPQQRPRGWVRDLPKVAGQTVVDLGIITAVLARSVRAGDRSAQGRLVRRSTDATGASAGVRRAWLAVAATYSPNAYVVNLDEETGEALLHDLRVHRPSEEPVR